MFKIQAGDALFFCFVKLVISFLVLRFLLFDLFNMYANVQGGYCTEEPQVSSLSICNSPFIDIFSTPNRSTPKGQHFFIGSDILGLLFTMISIFFFIYGRVKLFQLYLMLESWDVTEDDYSILVEDIPLIPFEGSDARVKDVTR